MAEVSITFKIDGIDQEIKSVDDLNKAIVGLTKTTKEQEKAEDDAGESSKKQQKEQKKTEEGFKKLQLRIREANLALQEAAASGDKLAFEKARKELDDLNDELDKTRLLGGQLDDQLTQLPGAAGQAGQAFKGFNDTIKVFLANPILLVVTAIVGAFMAMKKSLESTAEGQATLNKISQAFSGILGPVLAIIEKVALPLFNGFATVLGKVAEGFSYFAEKIGISSAKIKEATLAVDEVQQKANEAAAERAKEQKKLDDEKLAKNKELRDKIIANQIAINAKLKDLSNELIKDEVKAAEAKLQTEYQRAKDDFISKGANKEQLLALEKSYGKKIQDAKTAIWKKESEAYDAITKEQLAKVKERNDKEAERIKASVDFISQFRIQMAVRSYNDLQIATDEQERLATEQANKLFEEKKLSVAEHEAALDAIQTQFAYTRGQQAIDNQMAIDQMMEEYRLTQKDNQFEIDAETLAIEEQKALDELTRLSASEDAKQKVREYYAKLQADLNEQKLQNDLKYSAQALGQLKNFLGESTGAGKIAGSAEALINTYLGASQVISDKTVPAFLKPIMAGLIIAQGLKTVADINAVELPKFANGGMINGPSHSSGGTLIEAEGGEFIVNKYAMAQPGVASMAMALNGVAGPAKFANGGMVSDTVGALQTGLNNMILKTYVVSDEMTSSQEATQKIQRLAKL
jgi:hypothetical protein